MPGTNDAWEKEPGQRAGGRGPLAMENCWGRAIRGEKLVANGLRRVAGGKVGMANGGRLNFPFCSQLPHLNFEIEGEITEPWGTL